MKAFLPALFLAVAIPTLGARVNDEAGVMKPADVAALNALLQDLERTDSTQVVLLTVKTTGEKPIEDFALEVARKNGIGQKGKSNGALVVVAVDDHHVRIEVGEGLEGKLPDTTVALIIKHEMVPRLRAGDVSGGARAGVEAVARAVRGEYKAPAGGARPSGDGGASLFLGVVVVVGFLARLAWRWAPVPLGPPWIWVGLALFGLPLGTALSMAGLGTLIALFAGGSGGLAWFGGPSYSSSSSSYSSHSSSSGSFSGGGGSFSGGGASGSW